MSDVEAATGEGAQSTDAQKITRLSGGSVQVSAATIRHFGEDMLRRINGGGEVTTLDGGNACRVTPKESPA